MQQIYNLDLEQYKIKKEQNIILAKKYLVSSIYNAARIEGCNVTYPDTQTILEGAVVNNVSVNDIQTVLNLRDAYKLMLNNIDMPFSLDYVCKINEAVSRNESLQWGTLRTGRVGVGGTDWKPQIPDKENVEINIKQILLLNSPIDAALEYFSYAVKSQLFWDGNKRTSIIAANKILIDNQCGILNIQQENILEFNKTLLHYYNTDDNHLLRKCLKRSIYTIDKNLNMIDYYSCETQLVKEACNKLLYKGESVQSIKEGLKKYILDDRTDTEISEILGID